MQEFPVTSSDKTLEELRDDIIHGRLLAGSKLSESSLSTKYGVSRAVIREAINRLLACQIVERTPNVGANVVKLSEEGLAHVYELRATLESSAAYHAALRMPNGDIKALKQELLARADDIRDSASYYQEEGDLDFHYRIILASQNPYLISALINNLYHLIRMYRVQFAMQGPRVTKAYQEHLAILEAIEHRDAELAGLLMRRHITYSQTTIQTIFQKSLERDHEQCL